MRARRSAGEPRPIRFPTEVIAMPRTAVPSRPSTRARVPRALLLALALVLGATPALAVTPRVHAIRNARIVTGPGNVIARGTVVMRDGLITAVGANVAIPADARIWEGDSLTVYPGLIDAYVLPAPPAGPPAAGAGPRPFGGAAPAAEPPRGPVHELSAVRAEYRMVQNLPLDAGQLESLRAAGFAAAQVAPRQGVVRGTTALVGLGTNGANANVVRADVAQVMALEPSRGFTYPGSLMGAIAL